MEAENEYRLVLLVCAVVAALLVFGGLYLSQGVVLTQALGVLMSSLGGALGLFLAYDLVTTYAR